MTIPLLWVLPAGGVYAMAMVALALWIRRHELASRLATIHNQAEKIAHQAETVRAQRVEVHRLRDNAAVEARVTNALAQALDAHAPGRAAQVIDLVTGHAPKGGHRG